MLEFTPAYASMTNTSLNVGGKSDFTLTGRIENYIPYVFSDKTIKGTMSMHSKLIDVSEIMSKMATDTTAVEDTTSLSIIRFLKISILILMPRLMNSDMTALKLRRLKVI